MPDHWLIIIGMGVITYAIRLSMIAFFGGRTIPPVVYRALRFVPPAVLSALVAPALLRPAGPFDLSLGNTRLLAGVLAVVVAWRTKSTLLTIALGMAALWFLQWALH